MTFFLMFSQVIVAYMGLSIVTDGEVSIKLDLALLVAKEHG